MKSNSLRRLPASGSPLIVSLRKGRCWLPGVIALASLHVPAEAALTAYRNAVLGDGATAYYEFEETGGTVAGDSAGGDNNGAFLGGTVLNQSAGPLGLGRSVSFNGTDARVRIPDSPVFDVGSAAFSLEVWYRSNTTARGDLFTYKGTGGDFGIHSSSQNIDTASLYHNNFRIQNAPVNPAAGAWNHLVAVRSGTVITMYVNGVFSQSGADAETMNITNDLLIGSNHNGDPASLALLFNGNIDEVAFYPSALSAAQVANHFALASVPEPAAAGMLTLTSALALRRRRR